MSLSEISSRLRQTADSIDSNAETLNRLKFLKLADTFLKTLQKFDSAIAEHSAGPTPEVHELETNLKSLFAPTEDTKRIGQIAKSAFGAAFNPKKTEDFSAYVARVAEQAVALGKQEPLRQALQSVHDQRAESESLRTEEDLIMKVVSLASLSESELEREQARLIGNPELFLRLAEAVAIPKAKNGKLIPNKTLFGKLMKAARRLDRNIQQGA
jgi:anion-transporting  ArsA/GET3 family ATPase